LDSVIFFVFGAFALFIAIWFCILLPYGMAERRGRHPILWVLVSLLISPILAVLLLLMLGDAPSRSLKKAS
jgi:hypothetical protein